MTTENHMVVGDMEEYERNDANLEQDERDPDADRDLLLDDDGCAFFEDQVEI